MSALNPQQSCRLVGWKHENLPAFASFWPTTANPPFNQSICFCRCATGLGLLLKQTGINSSRIAENKVTALNPSILCCKTGNEKKHELQTHFGPLLPPCQTCFGNVCLRVSVLTVSDQIPLLHAFSVLQILRTSAQQQQQQTNHNEHAWKTLHSKSGFVMVVQKSQQFGNYLYELSILVVTTDSFRKDVAKKLPGTEQCFQG